MFERKVRNGDPLAIVSTESLDLEEDVLSFELVCEPRKLNPSKHVRDLFERPDSPSVSPRGVFGEDPHVLLL